MERNNVVEGGSRLKVKKFRIKPRIPSVKKILKAQMGVSKVPPEIESAIPDQIDLFLERVIPHAFYETWGADDMPDFLKDALKSEGFGKALSVSALVATIGEETEGFLSEVLLNGKTNESHLITALAEESADLSFQFLLKLLSEDAKQDDCELGDPLFIAGDDLLAETLDLLNAEEEGVTIDQAFHLSPRFTRVGLVPWLPSRKKKKSGSVTKKK